MDERRRTRKKPATVSSHMATQITIDKYLGDLAANRPVPGGGSAAALVAAIGMGLIAMAGGYAAKRHSRADSSGTPANIAKVAELSMRRLRKLMTDDERAYLCLSKKLKQKNSKDTGKFYSDAAEAPLKVCAIILEGLGNCKKLSRYCKTSIASDLAVAALFLESSFCSAKINALVNLKGVKDPRYTKGVKRRLASWGNEARKLRGEILRNC